MAGVGLAVTLTDSHVGNMCDGSIWGAGQVSGSSVQHQTHGVPQVTVKIIHQSPCSSCVTLGPCPDPLGVSFPNCTIKKWHSYPGACQLQDSGPHLGLE